MSILQHNETTVLSTDKSSRARKREQERESKRVKDMKHDQRFEVVSKTRKGKEEKRKSEDPTSRLQARSSFKKHSVQS